MRRMAGVVLFLIFVQSSNAQHTHSHVADRAVDFPDVPGYETLTCDFHMHTVFSDGSVWPDIRVEEAVRDSLDCIAITDHLEYQPHADDIPHPDRNRSFDLAAEYAEDHDLIVLRGAEVTRAMPPGHTNAIFIEDANPLLVDDVVEAFREADRQGGFIFWNHPHWTAQRPDGVATLTDLHRTLIEEGLLDGIEVANDVTYSDEALQIALNHDLVILGTSDIHGLVDWEYDVPQGGHRPVTLVFAEERSAAGIRAALDARRTTVWFENTLIGRPDVLIPLIDASITAKPTEYEEESSVLAVMLENHSDAMFVLRNRSDYTFYDAADVVLLEPASNMTLFVKTLERGADIDLTFEVLSALTAPNVHPEITLRVDVDQDGPREE